MSFEVVNLKRKRLNELYCLFCEETTNLVKEPKLTTLLSIKKAADRRKDDISEKFERKYNPDSTKQDFSWHQNCLASYISEEKIRRREISLYKKEEASSSTSEANVSDTPKFRLSSRQREVKGEGLKCLICKKLSRQKIQSYSCVPSFQQRNKF